MSTLFRRPVVEAVLVALPFLVLYQWLAALHVEAELAVSNNHYFAADPALYGDMFTNLVAGGRRWMHPLLPIAVGLPGTGLTALGLPPRPVACALTQLAAIGSLVLFQLVLRHAGCGLVLRGLGAALLGLSFSTLLHGVIPESFAFGALALLATTRLLQQGSQPGLCAVLLAAACYGTTVTNLGAWGGMALVAIWFDRNPMLRRWVVTGVIGMAAMLAVWALYETVFSGWGQLRVEPQYETVWWNWPVSELQRLRDLGSVLFAPDVVMMPKTFAAPVVFELSAGLGKLTTVLQIDADRSTLSYWPAGLAFGPLLLACTRWVSPEAAPRRLAWLFLANLLMQLPVYFLYGDALLAYSVHWTFSLCGGIVLLAHRLAVVGRLALAALVAALVVCNVPVAFDIVAAHRVWRDEHWMLSAAADGGRFAATGAVGMERGTARPFLLFPDDRVSTLPDAAVNWDKLPPYKIAPADWLFLGDGEVRDGEVAAQGVLPPGSVKGPAWVSLRLDGTWRGFRVEGFTFPRKLGR
ncbi:MAG: hypothetical protein KDC98_14280 [Planctomycetes bacterium]|nr:hypothetical protein [Planctomycetota bacterium]